MKSFYSEVLDTAHIVTPTPVYNISHFEQDMYTPNGGKDAEGHCRRLELVALVGDQYRVVSKVCRKVVEIVLPSYHPINSFYIDARFLEGKAGDKKVVKKLSKNEIISNLKKQLGTTYLWGGNVSSGIDLMEELYKQNKGCTKLEKLHWRLQGVDCSGILYEATNGATPRNTSQLFHFGTRVDVLSIIPLDYVVHEGHVMVSLGGDELIEARENMGVHISSLKDRLEGLKAEGISYDIRRPF